MSDDRQKRVQEILDRKRRQRDEEENADAAFEAGQQATAERLMEQLSGKRPTMQTSSDVRTPGGVVLDASRGGSQDYVYEPGVKRINPATLEAAQSMGDQAWYRNHPYLNAMGMEAPQGPAPVAAVNNPAGGMPTDMDVRRAAEQHAQAVADENAQRQAQMNFLQAIVAKMTKETN